jgi:hypothetical protein
MLHRGYYLGWDVIITVATPVHEQDVQPTLGRIIAEGTDHG